MDHEIKAIADTVQSTKKKKQKKKHNSFHFQSKCMNN